MSDRPGAAIPCRVLVVDDDPMMRLLAGRALTSIGMTVEEAEDGQQALDAIRTSAPDLLVLDVELPGQDGLQICQAVRELPGGRDIPVLILTGRTDPEIIDQAFQAGASDFINKPIDWQLLQHRVRFLMRAHAAFADLTSTLSVLRESERRLANAQRLARVGSWEWVPGSEDMLWSAQVHRIFKIAPGAGASTYAAFLGVVHPEDREMVEKAMHGAVHDGKPCILDHRIVVGRQEQRVVRQQVEIIPGASAEVLRISGTIQDITERRRAEEQIRFLADYDTLTTLPNRRMMIQQLERVLGRAEHTQDMVGLLFLDLDRFKRINDTLGTAFADSVLKSVAERLSQCIRCTDSVGRPQPPDAVSLSRLGGDEFAIVLNGLKSSEDAAHVARRILETLRAPLSVDGQRLDVTASLGIALSPNDGRDPETLLRNAGSAAYHAKGMGRDMYQFFNEAMNERAIRNMQLETGLRVGIERGELMLHYQPLIDAQSGGIVSMEALVRWRSPDHGLVAPRDFIPLAEETGMIVPLGEWVLRKACSQIGIWREAGLPALRVAVNVSSHQVQKGDLVETVERALRDSRLDPKRLEIEITESALIGDEPQIAETLTRLRKMGVRLALDDFGTGYSSLSHLVQFPIDTLKIDQSFVKNLGISQQADAVIAAVVSMGHHLKLDVTAEGVETMEQEQFLRDQGCDTFQGYLFSRPVEADAMAALLGQKKSI